ncbi:hypothetical protein M8R20_03480 [Pseudomonas sp. R2.Fl]|nr:hypothetical protein [Pseudomonas sp. R2.Fl]
MMMPVRLLLILAALTYCLMPFTGMASPAMASIHTTISESATQADCPHASSGHAEKMADPASPHPEKANENGHCSACLTLPAEFPMAFAGMPPRAAEAAPPAPQLASVDDGPLVPPPRT